MIRPYFAVLVTAAVLAAASGPAAPQGDYDPMAAARGSPALPGAAPLAGQTSAQEGDPEFGNLPPGPGMEDTYYQCVACHSTAIIRQQHLTDARWDYLWTWMVEEQGMQETEPEVKDAILAYLKTHFSSER
ncbi:cytochrome C-552 [Jannaschia ovalis]|uniref:Cytochrome C-552 n=1 Tax=Jannaschia ovalis TaxID=3038773 RepID=A0ABY8LB71_9RHOB|nr:cytochrome C-552 [Jannaschia sp. GRR-S6-38]WGH78578.1 cytochrome C-552 [Jannaschia sp. GRR-S6-38]